MTLYQPIFWELLSILSLMLLGIFWVIEKVSAKKYSMAKLVGLFLIVSAALVLWVRLRLVTLPYEMNGFVDLILFTAMVCVTINFAVLILRACNIKISNRIERHLFFLAIIIIFVYGLYLFILGTPLQFAKLGAIVDYWIHPAWILVVLTLLAQIKWQKYE